MKYLILGADSYIGSYLYHQMKANPDISVCGTTRRTAGDSELRMYDIENDDIYRVIADMDGADKVAVLCIAVSNINQCYEGYEHAYHINVTRTRELIDVLAENGFRVIFFSSDNVYDGKQGNYTEEDKTSAINCYGKMKAEMEAYILKNITCGCIFRLSKVVCADQKKPNIFYEWESQYRSHEDIYCVRGNRLSFVALDDIYQACLLAGKHGLSGLYNVAGDGFYSRKELAELFFRMKGIENQNILECEVGQFHFKDDRPLNISMSNQKFCDVTKYKFTPMERVIDHYPELFTTAI